MQRHTSIFSTRLGWLYGYHALTVPEGTVIVNIDKYGFKYLLFFSESHCKQIDVIVVNESFHQSRHVYFFKTYFRNLS